jgi:hypothetical protein
MTLDFSSMQPEKTEKSSNKANNPTIPWVQASFDAQEWHRVPVEAQHAREIATLLGQAAEYLDKGLRLRVLVAGTEHVPDTKFWAELAKAGSRGVHVMYEAKTRVRRPRKDKGGDVTDVPDSQE